MLDPCDITATLAYLVGIFTGAGCCYLWHRYQQNRLLRSYIAAMNKVRMAHAQAPGPVYVSPIDDDRRSLQ